jgi:hypothetical protein
MPMVASGSRRERFGVESADGRDAEEDEGEEHDELDNFERGFGAGGRDGVERGNLLERLHDEDEDIESERGDGTDDVDPAPGAGEVEGVPGLDGDGEEEEGEDSDDDAGGDAVEGEEDPVRLVSAVVMRKRSVTALSR